MMNKFHQYHMITQSPWPIMGAMQTWITTSMMAFSFTSKMKLSNMVSTILLISTSVMWWMNIIKESSKEGFHQKTVKNGLKLGMIMFISSEVLFFTSFFWSYFHSSITPSMEIGQKWPPVSIMSFNPVNIPLLNTIILISSGVTVTMSHHFMLKNNLKSAKSMLMLTSILGIYFTILQGIEYSQAEFSISDSSYGSTFFSATGFHGIHVIIGTTFLITNLTMMKSYIQNKNTHIGFEMAAWYWHFVDVVWLFLYMSIYWWGK